MEGEIRQLLQQGLADSAKILCSFHLPSAPESLTISQCVLYGDVLVATGDFNQAVRQYQSALRLHDPPGGAMEDDGNSNQADAIRLKVAMACSRAKLKAEALRTLETVPLPRHTLQSALLLGKLSEEAGRPKSAVLAYQRVIELNPLAVTASLALVRLGADVRSLTRKYLQSECRNTAPFMAGLVEAHGHLKACHDKQAVRGFGVLAEQYPGSTHALLQHARATMQLHDEDEARFIYQRVRKLDPMCVEGMDVLAFLLHKREHLDALTSLAHELLAASQNRPEPWVAVALYAHATDQTDQCEEYLRKAMLIEPNHTMAHMVRGYLHMSMQGGVESAIQSLRKAKQLDRHNICILQRLVEAYLSAGQFKAALLVSKEALQAMPRNPKALALVGKVLSISHEGRAKAEKAFNKALSLDPDCVVAVVGIVSMKKAESKHKQAAAVLSSHVERLHKDFLYCMLGELHTVLGDNESALACYVSALSITPGYLPAEEAMSMLGEQDGNDSHDPQY